MPALLLTSAAFVLLSSQGELPAKPQPKPEALKAQAAYDKLKDRLAKAKTLKATAVVRMLDRVETFEFRILRANFAKITSAETGIYQNGKTYYDYSPAFKEYTEKPAPADGLPAGTAFSLGGIVGLEALGFPNEPKLNPQSVSHRSWQGIPTQAIVLQSPGRGDIRAILYLNPTTSDPIGWEYLLQDYKSSGLFKSFALDTPMKPGEFAWTPPKGAKKVG